MIQPPDLKPGDRAVILSPAGKADAALVEKAADVLRGWGLGVELSDNALGRAGRYSGTVRQRLSDLQQALDDPGVNLVFCSRGGYGTVQLLDGIDFAGIRRHPKWVTGFSDITLLHAALQQNGIRSLHAPMAKHFAEEGAEDTCVLLTKAALEGKPLRYLLSAADHAPLNRPGTATGQLFGGNLAVFCSLLGTGFAAIPANGILFIEDVGEEPYRVDRLIHQLKLAGVFDTLSGLLVGQFSDYAEDQEMCLPLYASIAALTDKYSFPVCFGFPVGHVKRNYPLVMGKIAELSVEENQLIFNQ